MKYEETGEVQLTNITHWDNEMRIEEESNKLFNINNNKGHVKYR